MPTQPENPAILLIVDGLDLTDENGRSVVSAAHTPYLDDISRRYKRAVLAAAGETLGLKNGEHGDAELGHLTIGSGRIVRTAAARLEADLASGAFFNEPTLTGSIKRAVDRGKSIHLIGLLSDGGVHSNSEQLYALLRMARQHSAENVFVHGILDGRDVPSRTADVYVEALEIKMADIGIGKIAGLCGRYYGMDQSGHWERTARAFTMMAHAEGERASDAAGAVRASFLRGITDEFIAPIVIEWSPGRPVATIEDGDLVIFFNHRGDGIHQLVRAVSVADTGVAKPQIDTVCLVEYDPAFGLPAAIGADTGGGTLPVAFDEAGLKNYRVTETSRFSHLTTLFGVGETEQRVTEERVFFQDVLPLAADGEPESRSFKIADAVMRTIEADPQAAIIANIPAIAVAAAKNPTRISDAAGYVDTCIGGIVKAAAAANASVLLTSSFGGNEHGEVSFYLIDGNATPIRESGTLADVGPTFAGILGLDRPEQMTGTDLRQT